jgi:hypothetical protein
MLDVNNVDFDVWYIHVFVHMQILHSAVYD